MTVLEQYDRAREVLADLARTLSGVETVDEWRAVRLNLDHVKLHAQRIRDRALLIEATVLQTRAERRLGALLAAAREAGELAERSPGRRPKCSEGEEAEAPPATLADIGIDKRLAARAAAAAKLAEEEFEALLEDTRERMAAGKAIIVDPVRQAEKAADIQNRRDAHATRTVNGGRVEDLHQLVAEGRKFGFIGMDPQWLFKTRSDAGSGRSAGMHYKVEGIEAIKQIPVGELLADDGALGMWVVDWNLPAAWELLAHWGLTHVTTLFTWAKTIARIDDVVADLIAETGTVDLRSDRLWHIGNGYWSRANPEDCWLATKGAPQKLYADVRQLIVAPVMEHSRKPDEWLARAERLFEGPYLELNARRLRPGWVSWGDELEFTGEPTPGEVDAGVADDGAEAIEIPAFLSRNQEQDHGAA